MSEAFLPMLHVAGALILAYVAIVVFLALFQRSLIYHPPRGPLEEKELRIAGYAPLDTPATGVPTLWYAPPAGDERAVVVFLHGNAGNVAISSAKVAPLRAAGHGVLLVEYPGFAQAAGRPSEESIVGAGRAGIAALSAIGVPSQRLVLWGESLGGGVATRLAVEVPVLGVILEAPFTSVAERAQEIYWWIPARPLVRDVFDNIGRIARIGAPLLIVHGERDLVTPPEHGRRLLAAAAEPKQAVFFPEGGHVDLPDHGMMAVALRFIASLEQGPAR